MWSPFRYAGIESESILPEIGAVPAGSNDAPSMERTRVLSAHAQSEVQCVVVDVVDGARSVHRTVLRHFQL